MRVYEHVHTTAGSQVGDGNIVWNGEHQDNLVEIRRQLHLRSFFAFFQMETASQLLVKGTDGGYCTHSHCFPPSTCEFYMQQSHHAEKYVRSCGEMF